MPDPDRLVDPRLITRIYEAAADRQLWPEVLEDIAVTSGAKVVALMSQSAAGPKWEASSRWAHVVDRYFGEGWAERDERIPPLLNDHRSGFRLETDYFEEDQLQRMAINTGFLRPLGIVASVASVIQGVRHDSLHVGAEGFGSHAAARSALPLLDALRPHLARSLGLWAKLDIAHARGVVEGLAAAGVPAVVVARDRKIRAANRLFGQRVGEHCIDGAGRLWFAAGATQRQLTSIIEGPRKASPRSVAFRPGEDGVPCALHVLPLEGKARDIFESDGWLVILAEGHNDAVPHADLLRVMFDLTPAEAALARCVAEGMMLEQIATMSGIKVATARVHLRSVFSKIGVQRQSDLRAMLVNLALRA